MVRDGFRPAGATMVQKVIEVVGKSTDGFAKAAANAVETAANTVRKLKSFRVTELEGTVNGQKIAEYTATVRIYFEVES